MLSADVLEWTERLCCLLTPSSGLRDCMLYAIVLLSTEGLEEYFVAVSVKYSRNATDCMLAEV